MSALLLSGVATRVGNNRALHPALAFTCVQDDVYVSSPKNHAQPVGLFDDVSENETGNGAVPDVGNPVKAATGAPADTGRLVIDSRNRRKRDAHNTLFCT